jgi:hypothetical protein
MLSKLYSYYKKVGIISFFQLVFFPIILFFTNSIRICRSLFSVRVLASGKWSSFNRFRPQNGINSLFYWTQALNFDRFGRRGCSPYIGTGNYDLGHWWFSSLTSSYLYWRLGSILPLLCMFGWFFSHVIFITPDYVNLLWVVISLTFVFLSSYFYAATFVVLNYNVFGWLFLPVGLFGLLSESYLLTSLCWVAASLGSFTVIFIVSFLSLTLYLYDGSPLILCALLPAFVKLSSHLFFTKDPKDSLMRVVNAIGVNNSKNNNVKYKRKKSHDIFGIHSIYFVITWSVFATLLWVETEHQFVLLVVTLLLLWLLNAGVARFADAQSIYMAMFSVGTVALISVPNLLLLFVYWLCVSPPPALIGAGSSGDNILNPKSYKPFNVQTLINKANSFLNKVPKDSRILLALEDPGHEYSKIFDGYRTIYELLFYVGNKIKVLVFPDWWAVFENNQTNSSSFWGREPQKVIDNLQLWNGQYVITYQKSSSELETKWLDAGFTELGSMDWNPILKEELDGESCWGIKETPKWFLLSPPSLQSNL